MIIVPGFYQSVVLPDSSTVLSLPMSSGSYQTETKNKNNMRINVL